MKKVTTLILCVGVSLSMLAQKKELKGIEKLIKSSKFSEATESLKTVASLAKGTEYESYYYYLLGKNAFGDKNTKDYPTAAEYFYKTLDVEYSTGNKKYSGKSISYINTITDSYLETSNEALKAKDFKKLAEVYSTLYKIRPERKDYLDNGLYYNFKIENYSEVTKVLERLLKIQGDTSYDALNKHVLKVNNFFNKQDRDKAIKEGTHFTPSETVLDKDTRLNYYNNLISIYDKEKNTKEEIPVLEAAKKEFPNNKTFFEVYASVMYNTGDKKAYIKALEETLKIDPNNKNAWLNIAAVSEELKDDKKAMEAYDKVIELDPTNSTAYINKAVTLMSKERSFVKEMNENLDNPKKYKAAKEKRNQLYLKVIPLFEKAYELKPEENLKSNLMNLYKSVGQPKKAAALK